MSQTHTGEDCALIRRRISTRVGSARARNAVTRRSCSRAVAVRRSIDCLGTILVGLLLAAPASGEILGPSDALYRHAKGEAIARELLRQQHFWAHGTDLGDGNRTGRGVGSQDHLVTAHAAIGDYEWIGLAVHRGAESRTVRRPLHYTRTIHALCKDIVIADPEILPRDDRSTCTVRRRVSGPGSTPPR